MANELGDACSSASDCKLLVNAECDVASATCQCIAKHFPESDDACTDRFPNKCDTSADCATAISGAAECIDGVCNCAAGYSPANISACVRDAVNIGDACVVREQCQHSGFLGVTCRLSDGTCQCQADLVAFMPGRCTTPALHLESACFALAQCQAVDVNAQCVERATYDYGGEWGTYDDDSYEDDYKEDAADKLPDYVCRCGEGFETQGDLCLDSDGMKLHILPIIE